MKKNLLMSMLIAVFALGSFLVAMPTPSQGLETASKLPSGSRPRLTVKTRHASWFENYKNGGIRRDEREHQRFRIDDRNCTNSCRRSSDRDHCWSSCMCDMGWMDFCRHPGDPK